MTTRELPILFTGEMVRAILDGRKTQTRRVIKPQPPESATSPGVISGGANDGEWSWLSGDPRDADTWEWVGDSFRCPYGQPGDRLYVRETHVVESNFNIEFDYDPPFNDGRPVRRRSHPDRGEWWEQCHYRATDPTPELAYDDLDDPGCRWGPSIFMPKWAARIWLEVTAVRVERVQLITPNDLIAEGLDPKDTHEEDVWVTLWDSINAKRGYDWESNPWVWVVTFTIGETP